MGRVCAGAAAGALLLRGVLGCRCGTAACTSVCGGLVYCTFFPLLRVVQTISDKHEGADICDDS